MVCGAEMRLDDVAADKSASVSGFEHHTFKCPSCGDVEERLAFVKPAEPNHTSTVPSDLAHRGFSVAAEDADDVAPNFANGVCGDIEQRPTVVSEALWCEEIVSYLAIPTIIQVGAINFCSNFLEDT